MKGVLNVAFMVILQRLYFKVQQRIHTYKHIDYGPSQNDGFSFNA